MKRRVPNVLNADEQARLLRQPSRRYPTGERNHVLLLLMLGVGLRLSEAINLEWRHVDLQGGSLFVENGKGGKDAYLWLNDVNVRALQEWRRRQIRVLNERGHGEPPSRVFTTLDGDPLGKRYIQRMVKRYAQKAGIEKDVYPHLLRHSFATELLRQTHNLRVVQRACRHADISTTQIYTHIVDEELKDAMHGFKQPA